MTWIIIFSLLFLLLLYVLLAPMYMHINTPEARYEAGLKGLFRVYIKTDVEGLPEMWIRAAFVESQIRIFNWREKKVRDETKEKEKKKHNRMTRQRIKLILKITWKIITSFKLKMFKLNIDTGDVIRNAHLIPVFSVIYQNNIQLSVNYEDKNEFILRFENNLGTILLQIITTFIKHHLKNK